MIVEDFTMFLEMAEYAIKVAGFNSVETYNNVLMALERIDKKGAPDLIITDYDMPHLNGLDFVDLVSARYPYVKVIIITGNPELVRSKCDKFRIVSKADNFCTELIEVIRSYVRNEELKVK